MKMFSPYVLGLSLAVAGSTLAAAQDTTAIPKVLQITREYTKPYKNGMAHDKTESAFIQAMTKAKFPAHYIGLTSMSGKSRALFLTRYADFAEWEKDNKLMDKNPTLNAEVERDAIADGELLESVDSLVYTFDEDLSYKPMHDISHVRYLEISVFHVRAGHRDEWMRLAKIVKAAHDKAGTSAHWGMFEVAYGTQDGEYIALSGDKSMADIDTGYNEQKSFMDALGEDGVKEFRSLYASAVDYSRSELFAVNPKESYVPDEWIKADPDFWKPKAAAAAAPKPAADKKP